HNPYERWEASLALPTTDELPTVELSTLTLILEQLWKTLEETVLYMQKSISVRTEVARTLGQMGDSRAIAGLQEVLRFEKKGEWAIYVRRAAVEALGRIGDPRAVDDLKAVLLGEEGFQLGRRDSGWFRTRLNVGESAARA